MIDDDSEASTTSDKHLRVVHDLPRAFPIIFERQQASPKLSGVFPSIGEHPRPSMSASNLRQASPSSGEFPRLFSSTGELCLSLLKSSRAPTSFLKLCLSFLKIFGASALRSKKKSSSCSLFGFA